MADYAKKKNDELATLCKERGLPHTGKKADLVKRLEDHDAKDTTTAKPAATSTTSSTTLAAAEEEIDWDDEPAAADTVVPTVSHPEATGTTEGGLGAAKNPQAVPNQAVGEDVTQPAAAPASNAEAAAASAEPAVTEPEQPAVDFSAGLETRTLDDEIAKRKRRAEKFGLDISQDETLKQLERAKRFGTNTLPGGLNSALPEKRERGEKRGREGGQEGGARKQSRGRNGEKREGGGEKKNGAVESEPSGLSEKDREAAERRKARFAKPAEAEA
nr:hypothetical protein B0A51_18306 [Rachicladosporium sp. CCFEE 5018]